MEYNVLFTYYFKKHFKTYFFIFILQHFEFVNWRIGKLVVSSRKKMVKQIGEINMCWAWSVVWMLGILNFQPLKFMFSKKTTKIDEIFTVDLTLCVVSAKSTVKISLIFVAFLENMNITIAWLDRMAASYMYCK